MEFHFIAEMEEFLFVGRNHLLNHLEDRIVESHAQWKMVLAEVVWNDDFVTLLNVPEEELFGKNDSL